MEVNPYQSPEMTFDPPVRPSRYEPMAGMFVDGKCLVVPSGVRLPPVCIKTNEPLSEYDMVRRTYYWCSPLALFLLFFGPLIVLIAYFIVRKRFDIAFGLQPRIRSRYRWVLAVKVLVCIGCFVLISLVAGGRSAIPILMAVGAFVVSFIVACFGNSPLSIARHRDGLFWIKGCCPEFLDAMDRSSTAMRPEIFVPPFPGRARR